MRLYLIIAGAVAVIVVGAYWYGRDQAVKRVQIETLRAQIKAERQRQEVDNVVESLSDRDLCVRLGGVPDDCNKL